MRKQKVALAIRFTDDEVTTFEVICNSHVAFYDSMTDSVKITFDGGEDENEEPCTEIVIARSAFISRFVTLLPEETITIPVSEYEGLKETVAILSDPELVAELKKAEDDIKAGRLHEPDLLIRIADEPAN